jgi:hypothetical protein
LGLCHLLPKDQRAGRANIDGTEMLQRFGKLSRPESPVAPDVHSPQKNNECHSTFLQQVRQSNSILPRMNAIDRVIGYLELCGFPALSGVM